MAKIADLEARLEVEEGEDETWEAEDPGDLQGCVDELLGQLETCTELLAELGEARHGGLILTPFIQKRVREVGLEAQSILDSYHWLQDEQDASDSDIPDDHPCAVSARS